MSSLQEQFQAAPFRASPDSRFFYSNLDRLEVLAALRFGIEARKGLVLFTGDAGTGKTSVLHELTRELGVHAFELRSVVAALVQDSDQIDHRPAALQHPSERRFVMHVGGR